MTNQLNMLKVTFCLLVVILKHLNLLCLHKCLLGQLNTESISSMVYDLNFSTFCDLTHKIPNNPVVNSEWNCIVSSLTCLENQGDPDNGQDQKSGKMLVKVFPSDRYCSRFPGPPRTHHI